MDLLNQPTKQIDWALEGYRKASDDLADAAVAELIAGGSMRGGGVDLLDAVEALARSGGKASAALLEHANTVPRWVDFEAMRPGTQLGLRTPVQSALALILGSLMESYGSAKGAKVLIRGGMLHTQVIRRLHDTTTFVLEIAKSRGPRPGSRAHRHIIRTRLVHGFVRHGMLKRGDWDFAWGHPVNQEDYASTLLAFCHVYLRSMNNIGAALTQQQEDSVHHLWRWVGHVMGIAPELLSANRDEERALYGHISRRQLKPDDDSRVLAASLIGALASRKPLFLPAPAIAELARQMLPKPLADGLEIPRATQWHGVRYALPLLCQVQRRVEQLPFSKPVVERLGERLTWLVYTRGLT